MLNMQCPSSPSPRCLGRGGSVGVCWGVGGGRARGRSTPSWAGACYTHARAPTPLPACSAGVAVVRDVVRIGDAPPGGWVGVRMHAVQLAGSRGAFTPLHNPNPAHALPLHTRTHTHTRPPRCAAFTRPRPSTFATTRSPRSPSCRARGASSRVGAAASGGRWRESRVVLLLLLLSAPPI